jgi:hypothetical protein
MPDKLDWKDLAEQYGWAASLVKSDPDLLALFKESVTEGYTAAQFTAKLQGTDWFRKHSASWRKAKALQASDPATWQQNVEIQVQKLKDVSARLGAQITDKRKIANNSLMFGWDESQIQNTLAGYINELKGSVHFAGQAGMDETELRKALADNGIKMSQGSIENWVKSIARGDRTLEDAKTWVKSQAELAFPAYKEQIRAGMNVRDIAAGYTQSMAEILELNPDSIKMDDKMIRKALTYKNDKGLPEALSQTDFELMIRQDPRWRQTQNAQDEVMGNALKVLRDWGFKA